VRPRAGPLSSQLRRGAVASMPSGLVSSSQRSRLSCTAAGDAACKAVSDKQVSSRNRSRAVIVGASPCARSKVEQAPRPPGRLGGARGAVRHPHSSDFFASRYSRMLARIWSICAWCGEDGGMDVSSLFVTIIKTFHLRFSKRIVFLEHFLYFCIISPFTIYELPE
jgi:hypothetical protein